MFRQWFDMQPASCRPLPSICRRHPVVAPTSSSLSPTRAAPGGLYAGRWHFDSCGRTTPRAVEVRCLLAWPWRLLPLSPRPGAKNGDPHRSRGGGLVAASRTRDSSPIAAVYPSRASGRGGIGRRDGFRSRWAKCLWRFESSRPHSRRTERGSAVADPLATLDCRMLRMPRLSVRCTVLRSASLPPLPASRQCAEKAPIETRACPSLGILTPFARVVPARREGA